ncbi:TIGR03086 family metal-binding protein [Motilibacter aurantiacus]|uniref:TIGR03086 family metal-binding protein n=1 Tax=Motilibacter aurantiacus TaxID=2714955 RepID=UPI00140BB9DA|nr:TIGR03086 family metal-binding protein [Motilibacter aurantiacus]NHC43889.1 TIGR03086 family protein [Motilibacter aurantiacus]
MTTAVDHLESVLDKTAALIAEVRAEQGALPTPCPGYDVSALVGHQVEWVSRFADALAGGPATPQPGLLAGDQFRAAAERAVAALRAGASDREVSLGGDPLPGAAVAGMMLMEYITHGWDLAEATGQPIPFSEDEAEAALATGRSMLTPELRGDAFAFEVPVPDDASAVDRLVGFLGREPRA